MTTRCFERQLEHFVDSADVSILTFDPRGQGLSSMTTDGHFYEQHGHDLKALLDALDVEKFVLLGWSAGGADILEYVRLYGSKDVRGLTLLEAWPKARTHDMAAEWAPFGTKDNGDQDDFFRWLVIDLMADRSRVNRQFAEWMLSAPTPENLRFVNEMTNCTPDAIAALLNATYWFLDHTAELEKLDGDVPLLFYTREDQLALARDWAAKHTPSARVDGHGSHMMFWEDPERFHRVFEDFLSGLAAPARL